MIFRSAEKFCEWRSILETGFKSLYKGSPKCVLVVTSGGFDPLHVGHVRCILSTAEITQHLKDDAKDRRSSLTPFERFQTCVIVNGDGFLIRKKGKFFMTEMERAEIIASISGVDHVIIWDDGTQTVEGCLEMIRPTVFAKGGDRSSPGSVPELDLCQKIGCEIRYGVGGFDKIQSSSDLIRNSK